MPNAIAVLISDVHYSLPTLELADKAMRMAIAKANELQVPLIVAGDLHDTKANMRAECVNAMINTFEVCNTEAFILRGNHDSMNEKSTEHALEFLSPYATLLATNGNIIPFSGPKCLYLIPYNYNPDELRTYLKTVPPKSTLIMHQGLASSNSGEYIQDKSAINPEDVAGFRVRTTSAFKRHSNDAIRL